MQHENNKKKKCFKISIFIHVLLIFHFLQLESYQDGFTLSLCFLYYTGHV